MEFWEFGSSYAMVTHKTIFKSFQIDESMFFFRKKYFFKKSKEITRREKKLERR